MLARLPVPAIIAHRGASYHAPENTLAAFQVAIQQGADAIELDAKLSRDQQVVVIHDQTVDRTTDGSGNVDEFTLSELKRLDAGGWFGDKFTGERIPTLDEVFACLGEEASINVELTNYASPLDPLPEKVADLVESRGLTDRVLFSSFNPLALIRIRRCLPRAATALLAYRGRAGAWARGPLSALIPHQALHPHHSDVTPRLIDRAHAKHLRVHAYTVNEEEEMSRLLRLATDGVFTDDPLLGLRVRTRLQAMPA